jgi:hypothetical protein
VRPRYLLDWIQYVTSDGAVAFSVVNWSREDEWPMWRYLESYRG